jgi:hypothetical protein
MHLLDVLGEIDVPGFQPETLEVTAAQDSGLTGPDPKKTAQEELMGVVLHI